MIYYQRVVGGQRIRRSTKTGDWSEAAAFRDLYEQRKGIGRFPVPIVDAPRFADFAKRYLAEDVGHLATTTRQDRERLLGESGPLLPFFGARRLDEITPGLIREWWNQEVIAKGRAMGTGGIYVDTLGAVLGYAEEMEVLTESPVATFRRSLRRRARTQRGRAESEPGAKITPVESPAEIQRIVRAAAREGADALALVLLCLDAGLRLGEALGIAWGCIAWGEDEDDEGRALLIRQSRPRGGALGPPKSGRARRVALSRRLRAALAALYRERFEPGPEDLVLPDVRPENFRRREWRRICKGAKVGQRAPKDLRDTFASQLLTCGVQLGYVSQQLGHADVAITARHYARWVGSEEYRDPMRRLPGEVPADLLARLPGAESNPTSDPTETIGHEGDEPLVAESSLRDAGLPGGAYWTRTSDLRGVSTAL